VEPECRIRLETFEGPLDLLFHLINRNRLDITEISISLVTNQYLEYLEFLKTLNVEVAAEYLVMAATLTQIKSRTLIPAARPEPEQEQPVVNIVTSLEELRRFRELAEFLAARPMLGKDTFMSCPTLPEKELSPDSNSSFLEDTDITIIQLVDAFKKLMGDKKFPKTMEIVKARVDMSARMEEIEKTVKKEKRLSFFKLFEHDPSRHMIIVSFLAILELAKQAVIRLFQKDDGGIMVELRQT